MKCFVISPIGEERGEVREHADAVFNYVINPVMKEYGIHAARADHIDDSERVTDLMISEILTNDLCVAVLSGDNPNVFYELALAQAAGRPVILMIEQGKKPPFDISDYQYITYDLHVSRVEKAKDAIRKKLDMYRQRNWTGRSIIHDYLTARYSQPRETSAPAPESPRYDIFISSPVTGVDEAEHREIRALTLAVIDKLRESGRYDSIYYSAQGFAELGDVDPPSISVKRDLGALRQSKVFLLIYPKRLVTSAVVEAGYALALEIPSYYFFRAVEDLPFMLDEAAVAYEHVQKFRFHFEADLLRLVGAHL